MTLREMGLMVLTGTLHQVPYYVYFHKEPFAHYQLWCKDYAKLIHTYLVMLCRVWLHSVYNKLNYCLIYFFINSVSFVPQIWKIAAFAQQIQWQYLLERCQVIKALLTRGSESSLVERWSRTGRTTSNILRCCSKQRYTHFGKKYPIAMLEIFRE